MQRSGLSLSGLCQLQGKKALHLELCSSGNILLPLADHLGSSALRNLRISWHTAIVSWTVDRHEWVSYLLTTSLASAWYSQVFTCFPNTFVVRFSLVVGKSPTFSKLLSQTSYWDLLEIPISYALLGLDDLCSLIARTWVLAATPKHGINRSRAINSYYNDLIFSHLMPGDLLFHITLSHGSSISLSWIQSILRCSHCDYVQERYCGWLDNVLSLGFTAN